MTLIYEIAITDPCYLPEDTTAAKFYHQNRLFAVGLTVNSGFE